MKRIILLTLLIPVLAHAQRYGHTSGSTFYWNKSGEAQKSDSIRYIQGSNITLTQSGNTLTIAGAAGAGSTASVRANVGWTSNGTTAQDTLATYYLINGKFQRQMWVDTDNDSVIIAPHDLYLLVAKDGTTILAAIDSLGRIYSGSPTGTSIALDPTSANNASIYFRETSDNADDFFRVYFDGANDRLVFDGTEDGAGNPYVTFLESVDIGGQGGDPTTKLVLSDGSSGACLMRAANNTTGTSNSDGIVFGIDASEAPIIWNYENSAMSFATNNKLRMLISASGGVGIGATTDAQANRAKFNVLGRAANDTLAIFSNDGGGVVGDSTVMIDHAGRIGIKTAPSASYSLTNLNGMLSGWYDASIGSSGNANTLVSLQNSGSGAGTGATINIDGTVIRGIERSSVVDLELVAGTNGRVSLIPGASGSIMIGQGAASTTSQAFVTIRTQTPTADTLFMVRNDKNSTLDSTMMVFANGDGYFGGNNLYQGGHRWRSNAAGDSLILYDGNTMIMAFLSDGTIADLVAGVPPTLWRNGPPQEYIWLLRIVVLLLLLLVAFKVYDYVKPRIRKHKTLPGEI